MQVKAIVSPFDYIVTDLDYNNEIEMSHDAYRKYIRTSGTVLYVAIKLRPDAALGASILGLCVSNPTKTYGEI